MLDPAQLFLHFVLILIGLSQHHNCIFTVQTQFEISRVVDRPHKQAISLPSRIVYKSHFLQPKPPPRLTGGFCTKFRNTRPPRRPAQILRHSGFTTLHNSDDFRSFFPFWAEYPACKIGFPASRNWLNDKHSAGTSMSTSLHVLKKFWHQVNIRPAACCFDWAKRNQCDGGRTRSEPGCDFLYTWALVIPCCWRLQWGHSDCSTAHVVSPTLARPVLPRLAIRMCRPVPQTTWA